MFKKKILAIVMCFCIIIGVTACGSSGKGTLDNIKEKGELVIGTSPDYPPYEFMDLKTQEILGFEMDMAKIIAEDLGVKLVIKDMSFDALLPALKSGKIDMVIAALSPTDKRKEQFDFSNVYYSVGQTAITKLGNGANFKTIEDFTGKKVAAQLGSLQATIAEEKIKDANITLYSKITEEIQALKSNIDDVVLVEKAVAETIVAIDSELELVEFSFDSLKIGEGSAIAVNKNNEDLLEKVNKTIKRIKEDGTMDGLVQKNNKIAIEAGILE